MKILCVFGKHQYGDPSLGIGTEYAAFIPALKNLGHNPLHFESWDRRRFSDYAELNQALLDAVVDERPDIILVVQMHYEIWLETLMRIKEVGNALTVCWTTDDSWKYREVSRFIGGSYDVMTTTYPDALERYNKDGISNVMLTQWAANSDILREPLSATECQYGVSFVGAAHGNRKKSIEALCNRGVEVSCFGYGWPKGPVAAKAIPDIMRDSIISLNFANSFKGQNQIKARTFEVPGAGGFLLTEYTPGLEQFYSVGKDIEAFRSIDELTDKIGFYLRHPEKRDSIALSGFKKTCRDHTYEIRMREVIDFVISSKDRSSGSHDSQLGPSFAKAVQMHKINSPLRLLRKIVLFPCILIWGEQRGHRAARRISFELSWRFFGRKTFTASGWPGRMFPWR